MSQRIIPIAALAAGVIALVLIFTGGSKHTLYAPFDNANQVAEGQEVHIAGRPVGQVASIDLVDGQARAKLELDDEVWPLPKGTTARARWGSTTSYLSRYVELYPAKGGAGDLEDGAILSNDKSAVELDEAFRIFRGKTDDQTRAVLDDLGEALDGQGDDLKRGVRAAPGGLDAVGDLVRELSADEERLRTLAEAGDRTTTALASRAGDLRELVTSAAGTIEEFAEHTRAQQRSLDRAPRTFDESTSTLARLDTSLVKLDALVTDIRPGAPALRSMALTARGALATLRRVAPLATATLNRGAAAAPALERLFETSP
ncbi:MAG TPA: MlaD family protein, partial [Solirubrobacteraceae bacterium]